MGLEGEGGRGSLCLKCHFIPILATLILLKFKFGSFFSNLPFFPPLSPPPLSTPAGAIERSTPAALCASPSRGRRDADRETRIRRTPGLTMPPHLRRLWAEATVVETSTAHGAPTAASQRCRCAACCRAASETRNFQQIWDSRAQLTSREAAKSAGCRGREDQCRGSCDCLSEMHVPPTTVATHRAVEAKSETRS